MDQASRPGNQQPPQVPGTGNRAPARPAAAVVAAAFGALVALVLFGFAVYVVVAGWSGSSGGGEIVVILLALVFAMMGAFYALGATRLLHSRFPQSQPLSMAGYMTILIIAVAMARSARGWTDDSSTPATSVAWGVAGVVVISMLVLISRPAVRQWIEATHAHSRELGHVPKRGR